MMFEDVGANLHASTAVLTLALFWTLWPISVARRDGSVVDLVWGPGFGAVTLLTWTLAGQPDDARSLILLGLVTLWSARLGAHMVARKIAEPHEDPRYAKLRAAWEPGFWWKSLFVIFTLQAVLQWTLTLGLQRAMLAPATPIGWIEGVGLAVAAVGLVFEAVADAQLARFRRTHPPRTLCRTGLWALSRHPNYFGELVFWWGVWLICAPVAGLWTILCPLLITALLRWVSGVPILEKRLQETRPEFDDYRRSTPMLAPRLFGAAAKTAKA